MNFTHTIKQLIAKADPSQATQLLELSDIERPNSIQIATLNEIKLAIAKSQKKLQIINELKNKITNRGLSLAESIETYPLDKINRFKTILETQSFLENQSEFLYLIEFLFPQDDSIYTLFEKLTSKESLDPNSIEIEDFSTYTQEDFQEKQIQEPRINVPKKPVIARKPKIQAPAIENTIESPVESPKKISKLEYLLTKYKRSICITLCLAIYHTTIRKKPATQTQSTTPVVERTYNERNDCTFLYPDSESIDLIAENHNLYRIPIAEFIERCEFKTDKEKLDTALSYINRLISDKIQYIQYSSRFPIELNFNLYRVLSQKVEFSHTSYLNRSQANPHLNKPSNNLYNLYNIDFKGFAYNRGNQNQFVISEIIIHNPYVVESQN